MTLFANTFSRLGRVFSGTVSSTEHDARVDNRFDALNLSVSDRLPKRRMFRS